MHLVPTFTYRPVVNTHHDPIRPIGLVLHVQAGDNSPYGWFNTPASQVSSTLWAGKGGQREQYVPSDERAWAQVDGNNLYCSIETEGYPGEPLTGLQMDTVAAAYADGARTFGWALAVIDIPGHSGLILHSDGGQLWGGHPDCPGPIRAGQRVEILRRAAVLLDQPHRDDPVRALQAAVHVTVDGVWGPVTDAALQAVRSDFHGRDEQAAVGTAVDGIWGPKSQAAYVTTVQAVQAALAVAVDGIWGPLTDASFVRTRAAHFQGA